MALIRRIFDVLIFLLQMYAGTWILGLLPASWGKSAFSGTVLGSILGGTLLLAGAGSAFLKYVEAQKKRGLENTFKTLDPGTRAEIHALLRQKNQMAAIRVLREKTGLGVPEARNYIDSLDGPFL